MNNPNTCDHKWEDIDIVVRGEIRDDLNIGVSHGCRKCGSFGYADHEGKMHVHEYFVEAAARAQDSTARAEHAERWAASARDELDRLGVPDRHMLPDGREVVMTGVERVRFLANHAQELLGRLAGGRP